MNWILRLWRKFLSNQLGQVPTSMETQDPGFSEPAQDAEPEPTQDFADPQASESQPAQEESFIDPASLPEELKAPEARPGW